MLFLFALLLGVAIWYAALHLAYPKVFVALFLFGLAVLHGRLRRQYPEDAHPFELPVYGYLLGLYLAFFWALLMALAVASWYPDRALLLVLPALAYPLALHHLTATRTWLDKIHFAEHLEEEEVPLRFWKAMGATGELYRSSIPMRDGPYHATPPFFLRPVIIADRRQDPYVAYYAHFIERRYGYTRFEFFIRLLPTALALWFFWNQTHSFPPVCYPRGKGGRPMKGKACDEEGGVLVEFALFAGVMAALAMVFLTDWRTVFSEGWAPIKNLLRR